MTKATLPKWDDERTEQLAAIVGESEPVSVATVADAAEALETTTRSVSSKLRKMGYDVESTVTARTKSFTDEQETALREFVEANAGEYTYAEIALRVFNDAEMARKVQGKLLSMELSGSVKRTEPKVVAKKYTEDEEAQIVSMIEDGAYMEDIAEALGRELNSIRGKTLAMTKSHGTEIPKQKASHATAKTDALEALGDLAEMTVEAIAEAIEKTARGVKTMLTHRGVSCKDYDGAKRAAKLAEKKEAS